MFTILDYAESTEAFIQLFCSILLYFNKIFFVKIFLWFSLLLISNFTRFAVHEMQISVLISEFTN